jgi:hypothetical protein
MYDGINSLAAGIRKRFPDAAMVAGYVDGSFAWTQAEWNLFPHAVHVEVAVLSSTNFGDVIDCETGDATPERAAAWVRMRKLAGYYRPTIYCSRSVIPQVRAATGNLILGKDYDIWCADYTGQQHQVTAPGLPPATCAATQYLNTDAYDASIVYDDGWPHRSAPKPPSPPSPPPADWTFGAPQKLTARGGRTSVELAWQPPAGAPQPPAAYQVFIYFGTECSRDTIVPSYPRTVHGLSHLEGSLRRGRGYTAHVVAAGPNGTRVRPFTYASVAFTTG